MTTTPFTIAVPEPVLQDLRARLRATRWPHPVAGSAWDYGTDLDYLKDVTDYWATEFDWRAQEQRLNALTHVRADVDGIGIHFVHAPGTGADSMPLLLLHGWPSSFVQMLAILPLLTDPATHGAAGAVSFDVVVASLPGFGFSDRSMERGMSVSRMAGLLHRLMTEVLGYESYGIRGSDLGAGVLTQISLAFPSSIIGVHTGGTNPWIMEVPDDLTPEESAFVANARRWNETEMAYAMEQSTKPQTLAVGLNDSPAGLAAWILEKFRRWSDCDGDLESRFSRDDLLTNLTIYWATETIDSSMRLYYETARDPGQWGASNVPTAALMSPKDLFPTPRSWAERTASYDRWTEIDEGGHFLEWEVPQLVADDLRAFFGPLTKGV